MNLTMRAITIAAWILIFQGMFVRESRGDPPANRSPASPWGVSASASSFRDHHEWFPLMREAGVSTVRLFPEWRSFAAGEDKWNWRDGDALVQSAGRHGLQIN